MFEVSNLRENGEDLPPPFAHLTDQPTAPLTVWRGAAVTTHGRGMSWSAHRDCAVQFAKTYAETHYTEQGIYRAVVPPKAVLGLFGDEREQEVVVNPNMLRGRSVSVLEEVVPPGVLQPILPSRDRL